MNGVKPPRGAVRITVEVKPAGVLGRHTATCSSCGWSYSNVVKSDVETHKRWHMCPVKP